MLESDIGSAWVAPEENEGAEKTVGWGNEQYCDYPTGPDLTVPSQLPPHRPCFLVSSYPKADTPWNCRQSHFLSWEFPSSTPVLCGHRAPMDADLAEIK